MKSLLLLLLSQGVTPLPPLSLHKSAFNERGSQQSETICAQYACQIDARNFDETLYICAYIHVARRRDVFYYIFVHVDIITNVNFV